MKTSSILTSVFALLVISFINMEVRALNMPAINMTSIISYDSDKSLEEIICDMQYSNFNNEKMNFENNTFLEENLQFEEWMFNAEWSVEIELINESELELEQWMLEGEWIETENAFTESELELEQWMLEGEWIKTEKDFTESELQLETWMQSPANWNATERL
ncbi:MAG: hypothetical protein ACP5E3_09270 [Bacteroidales bacterium]